MDHVHAWSGRFDDGQIASLLFPRSAWVFTLVAARASETWCLQASSWRLAGLELFHVSSTAPDVVRPGPCRP